MKFESKISGTSITDFNITPIFDNNLIELDEVKEKVKQQRTANFILDNFRFTVCENHNWYTTLDWDTILKISIMEGYPEYEKELFDRWGENWMNHYLRFNH